MTVICASIKTCANFPKFNGFISWTRNKIIAIKYKVNETYIMVVAIKSFATNIIIIKVPKFYTQIARRWDQIISFIIVVYTIYRILN